MHIKDRQEPFFQWELWFGENGPERHCSMEPGLPSVVARELEIATTVLKLAVFASRYPAPTPRGPIIVEVN